MPVRRRHLLLLVVGMLVAFTTAAAFSWSSRSAGGSTIAAPDGAGPTALEPAAPGRRWFAVGHVAVQVPQDWAQSERDCRDRVLASVVTDRTEWHRCLALGHFAPSLQLLQTDERASARYVRAATVPVPGFGQVSQPVFEAPARRTHVLHAPGGIGRMALVVPADDHVLLVEARSAALVREIVGSARLFPEEMSAVPLTSQDDTPVSFTFPQGSGIRVLTTRVESDLRPGFVVHTEPPPGAPLRSGSTVRVQVSAGPRGPAIEDHRFARQGWVVEPAEGTAPAFSRRQLLRGLDSQDGSRVTQVFLRRVTVQDHGVIGIDGRVDRTIDHRLVWLVISPDALFPRSGPCCRPHPPWYVADAAALYDAGTGRFLLAGSF